MNNSKLNKTRNSSSSCTLCHELLEKRIIDCISCLKKFHPECAGINRIDIKIADIRNKWICSSECGAKKSSISEKHIKLNTTKNNSALEDLEIKIKNLIDFQEKLSKKYDELVLLNQKISKEISEIKNENKDLKNSYKNVSSLTEIRNEINFFKQFNIRNNIVIKGINIKKSDDPLEIFMRLVQFLDVEVYETDIENAYIQKNFNSNSATLFICFFEYKIKKLFINSRQGKSIKPIDIRTYGHNFIIIEDQLTKEYSKLFKETKVTLKKLNFKFIWVRDGKICFRFDESSPFFIVDSLSHLREIEKDILNNK